MWQRLTASTAMATASVKKQAPHWTLDVVQGVLISATDDAIALTGIETELLACLASAGATVDKMLLCAKLYPHEKADPDRVNVSLSRLRRKLSDKKCGLMIRSLFGKGLALSEEVAIKP
jgi:DNA-binding response OmpR family regulator